MEVYLILYDAKEAVYIHLQKEAAEAVYLVYSVKGVMAAYLYTYIHYIV